MCQRPLQCNRHFLTEPCTQQADPAHALYANIAHSTKNRSTYQTMHRTSSTIIHTPTHHNAPCLKYKYSHSYQQIFSSSKKLSFPRYKPICLRAPGKCACNALSTLQTHACYRHTFPVNQRCAYNDYLLFYLFCITFSVRLFLSLPHLQLTIDSRECHSFTSACC